MKSATQIQLQVVMTLSPLTGTGEMKVREALKLMTDKKIHHLPIVRKNPEGGQELVGIVTHRDLLHATSVFIGTTAEDRKDLATQDIRLKGFIRKSVHTLPPTASLKNGIRLMLDKKIGCIPIVDNGRDLVGIVTMTDMLKILDELVM